MGHRSERNVEMSLKPADLTKISRNGVVREIRPRTVLVSAREVVIVGTSRVNPSHGGCAFVERVPVSRCVG